MSSTILSHRDLEVWQRAMQFVLEVYEATERFPKSERFNLTDQLRRAVVSIPANIAEGHGSSTGNFARYLDIALGSAAEVDTLLELAHRLNYLQLDHYRALAEELSHIRQMLFALRRAVRRRKRKG